MVVFTTVTRSYQLPAVAALPVFASCQSIVSNAPDLQGGIARHHQAGHLQVAGGVEERLRGVVLLGVGMAVAVNS